MAKFKRKLFKYLTLVKISVSVLIIISILWLLSAFVKSISSIVNSANVSPSNVYSALFKNEGDLKQKDGRINILLLGTGDDNHDGYNLTDTMIFLSLDPSKKDIFLLPIPRDIWSDELKDKVNSAYAYGESKKAGGGGVLAKAVVSEITNLPVHYFIKVNFRAFEEIIDLLGGVDVNVENSFVDNKFPIAGKEKEECIPEDKEFKCRYETVSFEKGLTHMNGANALNYIRSRNAQGSEGTDFARSKRQTNLLNAIKKKAFSIKTITDEKLLSSLTSTIMKNVNTDISPEEAVIFVKTALKFKETEIRHGVLDWGDPQNGKTGLLINPPLSEEYNYTWVLIPRNNSWKEIHDYIKKEVTELVPTPQ
jgi:polyisoprenyl-teichoic acid--peptidoglycan teichoic acid transferase